MNSIQTQTLSINGDGGGEAYIDFGINEQMNTIIKYSVIHL